jgi:diguanylate cyclase (GGDEF)-like protein
MTPSNAATQRGQAMLAEDEAADGPVTPGEVPPDRIDAPDPSSGRTNEHPVFLSTEFAGRREKRHTLLAVALSGVLFAVAVPFVRTPLAAVPAFTPIYSSCLMICDMITAVLLFGQFRFLRSWAVLVLAGGYLFTSSIVASYTLMFPGLFSPTGLLGAGPQSTSVMYMGWHAGFPLAVIGYAILKNKSVETSEEHDPALPPAWIAVFSVVAAVVVMVVAMSVLATAGQDLIPEFLHGNRTTTLGRTVIEADWALSLLALLVLWSQRPHRMIDLWLMVVMCAWLFDIALAAILNTGRYDLGWYLGRVYGLVAANFLLVVLLIENSNHYARLVRMSARLSASNKYLEQISSHDSLTTLANRRYFDSYLDQQIAIARRYKWTLSLLLCDIDSFRAFNDHYGHPAGDACLQLVAAALQSCARRPADLVARYGGEEFALIMPNTELAGAAQVAELVRAAVARLGVRHAFSPAAEFVSISGGVACMVWKDGTNAQQLIMAADQKLYLAKQRGRNRVVSTQTESE